MSNYSLMHYFYAFIFLFADNVLSAAELYDVQTRKEQHGVMHASLRVNRGFLKNNASRFDLSGAEQVIYTDPRTKQSFIITEDNEDAKTDTESISDNGEVDIECSTEPIIKHTKLATESLPLRFDSLSKTIIIPDQGEYTYNPELFKDKLDPPDQILWMGSATFKLCNGSRVTSTMRPFQTKEEDQALLQILDDELLRNQLQYMKGPAIEHTVRNLIAKLRAHGFTQKIIGEMFDVSQPTVSRVSHGAPSPKMIRNIQEKVATLSVEEAKREEYTGMDNLLFEKAYVHMINILKRFHGILLDAGTEEITIEETLNPKELFYTKKVNLMAMIAFLNGCHEAVASEHKSEIPTDISQIIYQGDLRTPRAAASQLLDTSNNVTAQNKRTTVASQPQNMSSEEYLLGLIEVQNKDTLLALSDDEFNSRVKSINSIKIRGKIRDIRTDYLFQLKKQQEEEETVKKTVEQRSDVEILLEKMGVATEEDLLKMDKVNFNIQVRMIMPLKDRLKIIHMRSVYESNLKEQLEREEAIKIAMDRETQLDRFYATMQIKKIYKHPDGSILGCEISDPEGLL